MARSCASTVLPNHLVPLLLGNYDGAGRQARAGRGRRHDHRRPRRCALPAGGIGGFCQNLQREGHDRPNRISYGRNPPSLRFCGAMADKTERTEGIFLNHGFRGWKRMRRPNPALIGFSTRRSRRPRREVGAQSCCAHLPSYSLAKPQPNEPHFLREVSAVALTKAAEPRLFRIFNAEVALRHSSVRLCSPQAGQAKAALRHGSV